MICCCCCFYVDSETVGWYLVVIGIEESFDFFSDTMRAPWLLSQCLPGFLPTDRTTNAESSVGIEKDLRLPTPAVEIIPSKNTHPYKYAGEKVEVQGLSIFKGKISVSDIIKLTSSPERFSSRIEGSKSCESSIDLVSILKHETRDGQLSFRGKYILELNCGYGLPGIFACLKGASVVHFHDVNAETIRCATIPNVLGNLEQARERQSRQPESPLTPTRHTMTPVNHFYAGDYGELHTVLSTVQSKETNSTHISCFSFSEEDFLDGCGSQDGSAIGHESSSRRSRKSSGSRAWERANENIAEEGGYDIILITEIPYSGNALKRLYAVIKKCLRPPYGVLYLTAKKNYIGPVSAARQLKGIVDEDGVFGGHMLVENTDREIWKFFHK